jgi:ribosomal protein S18 acetylase RimI-like enzyme
MKLCEKTPVLKVDESDVILIPYKGLNTRFHIMYKLHRVGHIDLRKIFSTKINTYALSVEIRENYRGMNIGSISLSKLFKRFDREKGYEFRVFVDNENNIPLIKFLEKNGFEYMGNTEHNKLIYRILLI